MMGGRLTYLLIGCLIGFVLGYIVRSIKGLEHKVEVVDEHVTHSGDAGYVLPDLWKNIALFLVVALTVFSAFYSQRSSNAIKSAQDDNKHVTACSQDYLTKTIAALNARTQNSTEQNDANVSLQKAQLQFLNVPQNSPLKVAAFSTYIQSLTRFVTSSVRTNTNVTNNPYPTAKEFTDCITKK